MSARVVLVRHGRTAWNRTRFLGRRDVPLDEVGLAQAQEVGRTVPDLLAGAGRVVVRTSPLLRARQTAAPLASRLAVEPVVHDGLAELDCGAWEGREKAEVGRKVSKLPAAERVPGGESAEDVARRLRAFLAEAGLDRPGTATVVVGHHLVNKVLHALLLGRDLDGALAAPDYRPEPGSVVLLAHDGGVWRRVPAERGVTA